MATAPKWTREELIIALDLYFRIPFKSSSKTNSKVIQVANLIGRSPSSVNMKVGNFGRLDPTLRDKGTIGLKNGSHLDEVIWNEFNGRMDALVDECTKLTEIFLKKKSMSIPEPLAPPNPPGTDVVMTVKQRRHQDFFRSAILASYHSVCCITGICTPRLLIASHIKPWKKSSDIERTIGGRRQASKD